MLQGFSFRRGSVGDRRGRRRSTRRDFTLVDGTLAALFRHGVLFGGGEGGRRERGKRRGQIEGAGYRIFVGENGVDFIGEGATLFRQGALCRRKKGFFQRNRLCQE